MEAGGIEPPSEDALEKPSTRVDDLLNLGTTSANRQALEIPTLQDFRGAIGDLSLPLSCLNRRSIPNRQANRSGTSRYLLSSQCVRIIVGTYRLVSSGFTRWLGPRRAGLTSVIPSKPCRPLFLSKSFDRNIINNIQLSNRVSVRAYVKKVKDQVTVGSNFLKGVEYRQMVASRAQIELFFQPDRIIESQRTNGCEKLHSHAR